MSRQKAQDWLCKSLNINFPHHSMGKVDSLDLFGPNELQIFGFYKHNAKRYNNALDIGANLGLHSILMARLNWNIQGFEPDPAICQIANSNTAMNSLDKPIRVFNAAVSDHDGEAQFVRVLNNLTGSHIEGYKESYGPRETITVPVVDCRPLFDWADLAKLDVEGHEGVLLNCVTADHLTHLDLICELRGQKEAGQVLDHFSSMDCPIYTQKNDWKPARCMSDMPTKHQEGSIFISKRGGPWD